MLRLARPSDRKPEPSDWASRELMGYLNDDELPDYRTAAAPLAPLILEVVVGDDVRAVLALQDVGHLVSVDHFGANPKSQGSRDLHVRVLDGLDSALQRGVDGELNQRPDLYCSCLFLPFRHPRPRVPPLGPDLDANAACSALGLSLEGIPQSSGRTRQAVLAQLVQYIIDGPGGTPESG